MTHPESAHGGNAIPLFSARPPALRAALLGWRSVLIGFYGAVALAFVGVVGSIVVDAVKNKSLIPPPRTLVRYDCSTAAAPCSLSYLHGTERVKMSSAKGVLEGTLHNNEFDWGSFGHDANQLGCVPPTHITAEDAQSLVLQAVDGGTLKCIRMFMPDKRPA